MPFWPMSSADKRNRLWLLPPIAKAVVLAQPTVRGCGRGGLACPVPAAVAFAVSPDAFRFQSNMSHPIELLRRIRAFEVPFEDRTMGNQMRDMFAAMFRFVSKNSQLSA